MIDADKGLGDVVTPKDWVRTELYRLLNQGFDEIPEHEHISRTRNAQDALHSIIKTGLHTDAITDKQARFLSTALVSKRSGRFRLRVKLHKTPIVGRPIANLSRHWLAPASLLLCQALAPIQKKLPFVLTGSHDFVQRTGDLTLSSDDALHTIDAENLYPSIDSKHLFSQVSKQIDEFYHGSSFAHFAIELLRIVLDSQCVEHDGRFFYGHGIATGLPPGVFLANIYLAPLDALTADEPKIKFYYRFVDDTIICSKDHTTPLMILNSYHSNITWLLTATGGHDTAVPFLDLSLKITGGQLFYETYRKPLNGYLYIPKNSRHPETSFKSLIQGEVTRLIRTNRHKEDLQRHLDFFAEKLRRRGYDPSFVQRCMRRQLARHAPPARSLCTHPCFQTARPRESIFRHSLWEHCKSTCPQAMFEARSPIVAFPGHFRIGMARSAQRFLEALCSMAPVRFPNVVGGLGSEIFSFFARWHVVSVCMCDP